MADSSNEGAVKRKVAELSKQPSFPSDGTQPMASGPPTRPQGTDKDTKDNVPPEKPPKPPKRKESNAQEATTDEIVTSSVLSTTSNGTNDNTETPLVPPRRARAPQQETPQREKRPSTDTKTRSTTDNTPAHQPNDDRIIKVTGFDKSVTEEALKLYFENRKKSGGGPVDSVSVIDGTAVVHFKHASDAQNVLQKKQTCRGQNLSVVLYSSSESTVKNMFIFSGLSMQTPFDMLTDFLESKTGCSVLDVQKYSEKGKVLVVFAEDSCPEHDALQAVCEKDTLSGSTLAVTPYEPEVAYLEPVYEDEISLTTGQMRHIEKYDKERIQKELDKHGVTFIFDKVEYKLRLKGKEVQKAAGLMQGFLKDIHESEYQISMPGIVAFVKSSDARGRIASIEQEDRCIIDVREGTYEVITGVPDCCSIASSGTESEDSGGGHKGSKSPVDGAQNKKGVKTDVMREFQLVSCRLVMKTGNVVSEDSDCLVNITQDDVDNGDIWSSLSGSLQEELSKQFGMPTNRAQWKKTGSVITSAPGLPCNFILHVSQKHYKGDLAKTVIKCLQTAKSMEVSSVAFFSARSRAGRKDSSMEDSPKSLVDGINKYQKAGKSSVTCVRLVQENMEDSFVTAVKEEVEKLKNPPKGGFFTGKFRPKLPSRKSIKIISPSSMTSRPQSTSTQEPARQEGEEVVMYPVINADVTVYIYSTSVETNLTAFNKLIAFCEQKMPPKKVKDARIKKFSKSDVKRLRSKKVELDIDINGGSIELRGYPADVDTIYTKLRDILNKIPVPENTPPSHTDRGEGRESTADGDDGVFHTEKESKPVGRGKIDKGPSVGHDVSDGGKTDDDDDIFGKFVASEIRAIPDDKEKRKVKFNIKQLLNDAQAKYMAD